LAKRVQKAEAKIIEKKEQEESETASVEKRNLDRANAEIDKMQEEYRELTSTKEKEEANAIK